MRKYGNAIRLMESVVDSKCKCGCGHTITFLPSTKSTICSYCGHKVINKTKSRFRYEIWKLKENRNEI